MDADLIIRNGTVVDGTGAPGRRADVAIGGDRIVAVAQRVEAKGRSEIDATGRVGTPGCVDVHTHLDVQGFWDPTLSPTPLHGVTTAIGGNCGFTVAPIDEASADYLRRMLARVEGMPLESLEVGVPWDWTSTEEFLSRLDGRLAINTGFLVGHSALRRVVMGAAANERRAEPAEVEKMKGLEVRPINYDHVPNATYTDPEVASVGLTEKKAKERGYDVKIVIGTARVRAVAKLVQRGSATVAGIDSIVVTYDLHADVGIPVSML